MTDLGLGPYIPPAARPITPCPPAPALSRAARRLACCGVILLAGLLGGCVAVAYDALTSSDSEWPYDVSERRLVTPEVPPGGYLMMRRVIDYHDDCQIRYERRIQSQAPNGRRFIPQDVDFEHPPWDRSGKPQEFSIQLPGNFTCGPAYLVETVTVACTWAERVVKRRRKPDIITPFTVSCPQAS